MYWYITSIRKAIKWYKTRVLVYNEHVSRDNTPTPWTLKKRRGRNWSLLKKKESCGQESSCPYQRKSQTTQFLMEPTHLQPHFPSAIHVSPYLNLSIFPWKPFSLHTHSLLSSTPNPPLPRISSLIPSNPEDILFLSLTPFRSLSKTTLPSLSDHLSQFPRIGSPISNMGWRR